MLIDSAFQLRFAFYVCTWIFALSLVYPFIIYNVFGFFFRYLALDPEGPAVAAILDVKKEILVLLVLLQIVFLVMTFLISIFVSHRIAGPLYKLKKILSQARTGGSKDRVFFRKKDHFHDLATEYNMTMDHLERAQKEKDKTVIETAEKLKKLVAQIEKPELRYECETLVQAIQKSLS
ncbi:hypothetical protein WDW86_20245 [Bdellovibrionota bacterium FG-2]